MAINYAPSISGTLPAFYGDTIKVPFEHNRASNIQTFGLRVLDLNNNRKAISSALITKVDNGVITYQRSSSFTESGLNVGEYYKVQICYKTDNDTGPWSTVGIAKYTAEPTIAISSSTKPYYILYTTTDKTEKIYEYKIDIRNASNKTLYTTGKRFYQGNGTLSNNDSAIAFELESHPNCLIPEKSKIVFWGKTINGLEITKTLQYTLIDPNEEDEEENRQYIVQAQTAPGSGYINPAGFSEDHNQYTSSSFEQGLFCFNRPNGTVYRSEQSDFKTWIVLPRAQSSKITGLEYNRIIDNTIEHGKIYYYRATGNTGINDDSQPVSLGFDHMFLSDEERQLCIRFNPKASSFKKTILEQKTDTIGGPYPYFFRNGNVGYKEIPVSGLISYHMDNEELFMPRSELGISDTDEAVPTTNLVDYNVAAERKFKLEVLDWLTNGKPKLFRSPTEGNYIIRLMNVSLSPEEKLGRMLHSFSATGYEVAEWNDENVVKYILGGTGQ